MTIRFLYGGLVTVAASFLGIMCRFFRCLGAVVVSLKAWPVDYVGRLRKPDGWRLAAETAGVIAVAFGAWQALLTYQSARLASEIQRADEAYGRVLDGMASDNAMGRIFAIARFPEVMTSRVPASPFPAPLESAFSVTLASVKRQATYHPRLLELVPLACDRFRKSSTREDTSLELQSWLNALGRIGPDGWYNGRLSNLQSPRTNALAWIWQPPPPGLERLNPAQLLRGVHFDGMDLAGMQLVGANLHDCGFYQARLPRANLSQADVSGANFRKAVLGGATFREAKSDHAVFAEAVLQDADLSGLSGKDVDFGGAQAHSVVLAKVKLYGAVFRGATLLKAKGSDGVFQNAHFENAFMNEADFRDADLIYADFRKASVSGAVFSRADLSFADLRSANLSGADFFRASLRGADLRQANLAGAMYLGTVFDWKLANIAGCIGLSATDRQMLIQRGAIEVADDSKWMRLKLVYDHNAYF